MRLILGSASPWPPLRLENSRRVPSGPGSIHAATAGNPRTASTACRAKASPPSGPPSGPRGRTRTARGSTSAATPSRYRGVWSFGSSACGTRLAGVSHDPQLFQVAFSSSASRVSVAIGARRAHARLSSGFSSTPVALRGRSRPFGRCGAGPRPSQVIRRAAASLADRPESAENRGKLAHSLARAAKVSHISI
jgi:hypothetical protein